MITRNLKRGLAIGLAWVAILGMAGCDDDGGSRSRKPADISGLWNTTLTGNDANGQPFNHQGTMTIAQEGQAVSGSYTYYNGNTFTFAGTYVDGALQAVDSEQWTLQLEFGENSAEGTITGTHENGTPGVESIVLARPDPA